MEVHAQAPSPTADAATLWHYLSGQNQVGPRSLDELLHLIRAGVVTVDTFVWTPGMPQWVRAGEIDALRRAFTSQLAEAGAGPPRRVAPGFAIDPTLSIQPHPWRRWLARVIDYGVGAFGLGFALAMVAPESTLFDNNVTSVLVVCAVWLVAESFILASHARTPGKALLNIWVRRADGRSLTLLQAFTRSARVWLFGMGLGLPLISLFTMATAHGKLKRAGSTSWDARDGLVVAHGPIGVRRVAAIALIVLLFVGISLVPA